jgi:hypothetical protein
VDPAGEKEKPAGLLWSICEFNELKAYSNKVSLWKKTSKQASSLNLSLQIEEGV